METMHHHLSSTSGRMMHYSYPHSKNTKIFHTASLKESISSELVKICYNDLFAWKKILRYRTLLAIYVICFTFTYLHSLHKFFLIGLLIKYIIYYTHSFSIFCESCTNIIPRQVQENGSHREVISWHSGDVRHYNKHVVIKNSFLRVFNYIDRVNLL